MKAVQVSKPGGNFEVVERPIPEPGRGQVRIKVEACGICHSDALVKEGHWPGIQYPRVPGHEIAGRIDKIGADVTLWKPGQRVGVGWHGGHCFQCDPCRRGDFILCQFQKITAISFDGGYAEYTIVPAEAVAAIPNELPSAEAAPLLCAGITVFNSLRNSGARSGDTVAVQGIGGLGHLGIQYARQMGFRTVAIGRGGDKAELAKKLGAHEYVDQRRRACRCIAKTWRSAGDTGDGAGFPVYFRAGRWTGGKWKVTGRGSGNGVPHGHTVAADWSTQGHPRLAFRYSERFRRHAAIQLTQRRASDDRALSAGESH